MIVSSSTRSCPKCGNILTYTLPINCNKAEKNNKICRKCVTDDRKEKYKGVNNPFYGKHHTDDFKNKLSIERKGKSFSPSTQFKKGQKSLNKTPLFDIWVKKHGYDIAIEKYNSMIKKISYHSSGENNNMYGKPSPNGSGNGWSGWYNGWYFRSLHELSYMVNIIERFNLEWKSGENNAFKIEYINFDGNKRTYRPDFIINNKYLIEIKPKKLIKSKLVQLKITAAIEFAEKRNLIFKATNCRLLSYNEILSLYNENKIKFLKRYEEKFKSYR